MDSEFERQWRLARTLENQGRSLEAKPIYEALLEADPERLYVRLRLSLIEEGQGHYRAARAHALRCADNVRTQRWKDLAAVTRRLLTFDEHALVHELIMGTDWQDPDIIRNSAVLSQHLWLTDHVDRALELIQCVEPRAQPSPQLEYSKANALRYFGRMDEATAAFERCIALDPGYAYAHWSLAFHRKSVPPGARIARVRALQASLPADAEEQANLHYALFREYDDAGDTTQAWASLQAGAAAKRATLRYDARAEAAGFESLARWASTTEFAGAGTGDDSDRVPIFILGMPRTGTTLLERIFGGHDAVTAAGELNDFNASLCLATDSFLGMYPTEQQVARIADVDFADVGRAYLARTAHRTRGRRFLVDKNPANFAHAGFIARALPNARVLCLRRAPMDACFSNLKELFANEAYGYSYDLAELADYHQRFDRLCATWREAMPAQFMEVQYESLVTDTEDVVRRVLDFCGLPFQAACLDITRNTAPVATASSSQVRQPIHARGVGAWRRYEAQLAPLAERLRATAGASA